MRILLAVGVAVAAGCSGNPPEEASVAGVVRIGPTPGPCEVEKPCSRPAGGVRLLFSGGGGRAVSATTDERGRYRVIAKPGAYRIRAVDHPPPARLRPTTVTIEGDMRLDLSIDSGVR